MALKTLLAIAVTVGRLMPFMVLVPPVALPAKERLMPLVVTPAPLLLVKDKETRLSLLVEVVKVSANLPLLKVKLPWVMTSLPEVKVKFLPLAIVVSPLRETAPEPVWNVPPEADILKLPEDWV